MIHKAYLYACISVIQFFLADKRTYGRTEVFHEAVADLRIDLSNRIYVLKTFFCAGWIRANIWLGIRLTSHVSWVAWDRRLWVGQLSRNQSGPWRKQKAATYYVFLGCPASFDASAISRLSVAGYTNATTIRRCLEPLTIETIVKIISGVIMQLMPRHLCVEKKPPAQIVPLKAE